MPAEEDPAAMECREPSDSPQQFCLRWNNYQSNLTSSFDQLLQTQSFVDVTLSCDGQSLKAHKVVLSACSPYFQSLFMDNPCQHPIIIMRDTKYCDLKAAVDFMYRGEINVSQEQIPALLKVAESLKIRGLTDVSGEHAVVQPGGRSAKRPDRSREADSPPKSRRRMSEDRASGGSSRAHQPTPSPTPASDLLPPAEPVIATPVMPPMHPEDVDIRPGIAEMIREEERAKMIENSQAWLGASTSAAIADSYQYQLQSMWQKCWNTQTLVHNLRFRERGPLKSWRPETMAEAIFSVLKEGLSLSQAARKYDIPYPTFVLYANRVHNMLGPSADGGAELTIANLRPKGRGRPQRILLGVWPDEHIRGVIRAVVFRDTHAPCAPQATNLKEIELPGYPAIAPDGVAVPNAYIGCGNGREGRMSPNAAAAAAVAAVAHGLRRQMCNMVAGQRPPDHPPHMGPPMQSSPQLTSPLSTGLESPLCSPPPPGHALEPAKHPDPFRPFASPTESRYSDRDTASDITLMGPPKNGQGHARKSSGQGSSPSELDAVDGRADI
ncbi:protein bric-a-brac 1 isoform X1 [Spodoptera frugiperda]|uniref:Protein bric-a-brac 1 isoform X1 n=1 Tax=Spodoptera frugiperda TaxID=7108 RepID=A0A9R0ETH8_SPOFR|nr:protein bric-a-brac 1 isoform X1 [Spodoptera frugiperda]